MLKYKTNLLQQSSSLNAKFQKICSLELLFRKSIFMAKTKDLCNVLQCHCDEKIVDPILNATEQHFKLNGLFNFSTSCFTLKIFRFFETCELGVSDVIYLRVINYIYKMVNIFVNKKQNSFKLCMSIAV